MIRKKLIYIKKAMNSTKLKIEKNKNDYILTPQNYNSVLIWLHGLGDSANGYLDVFNNENRPVPISMKIILLTAPSSPVTVNGGMIMNSWYDIKSFDRKNDDIDQKDVEKNSINIIKVIEEESKSVSYDKIFLGGFSQGACMSLYIALTFEKNLGGVISMSGLLFPFTKILENKKKIPFLITHGKYDPLLPEALCLETYKPLIKDYNVIYKSYLIDHTIIMEELIEMQNFLNKYLV